MDWMDPLPPTLVMRISWKYWDPVILNLTPPCLEHRTLHMQIKPPNN
jgi:hypothetical protein